MSSVAVAVLTQPGAAADQLRSALDNAGAEVVWQGPPDQLDLAALPGEVVVVNLDPDTEAQLPTIESLLVDGTVRVVFNDATVSSGLSGWDLQRWARHLAAKVLDSRQSAELPDPPPGSEPLSVRASQPPSAALAEQVPVNLRVAGNEYIEDVISAEIGEPPLPYQAAADDVAPPPQHVAETRVELELSLEEMFEAEEPEEPGHDTATGTEETYEIPLTGTPTPDSSAAIEDETFFGGLSLEPMGEPEEPGVDPEGGSEARADRSGELVFTDDLDLITAPSDEYAADQFAELDQEQAELPSSSEESADSVFGELTLEPLELPGWDDEEQMGDSLESATDRSAAAGASKAAESGHVEPEPSGPPRQLWVLGGALGAAEAIAQFFHALPKRVNAAFLIVTHFERGNAELLARSLGSSGKHRVSVAGSGAGTKVSQGDIVVAAEGTCVTVTREGEVRSDALDSPAGTIDLCARAAADAFGMDAGIVLFSGSARDGFEGSLYLAQRGGVVWAQDPATCVAGAMAEAVRGRGLATYIGSPRGLAEHFVQEFGRE